MKLTRFEKKIKKLFIDSDIDKIKIFLDKKSKTKKSGKLLFLVIKNCKVDNLFEIIKLLLEYISDINWQDSDGNTILHLAAKLFMEIPYEIFELLILYGANVNLQNNKLFTPLSLICECYRNFKHEYPHNGDMIVSLVELFLENDYDLTIEDRRGRNIFEILFLSIRDNNLVDILNLPRVVEKINICDSSNYNTLHLFILFYHLYDNETIFQVLNILFRHGVDLNAKNGYNNTPIFNAFYRGSESQNEYKFFNLEMVEYLLNHGADINCRGKFGMTILHYNVKHRDFYKSQDIKHLLTFQPDLTIRDKRGYSILASWIRYSDNYEIIKILFDYVIDTNQYSELELIKLIYYYHNDEIYRIFKKSITESEIKNYNRNIGYRVLKHIPAAHDKFMSRADTISTKILGINFKLMQNYYQEQDYNIQNDITSEIREYLNFQDCYDVYKIREYVAIHFR